MLFYLTIHINLITYNECHNFFNYLSSYPEGDRSQVYYNDRTENISKVQNKKFRQIRSEKLPKKNHYLHGSQRDTGAGIQDLINDHITSS